MITKDIIETCFILVMWAVIFIVQHSTSTDTIKSLERRILRLERGNKHWFIE